MRNQARTAQAQSRFRPPMRYAQPMSFGRNPHVAKAEAAEHKAGVATDHHLRDRAWREAAHLWERAAERESEAGRRAQYTSRAEAARANADAPPDDGPEGAPRVEDVASKPHDPRMLN
jgi:hypothetical protein